MSQTSHPELVDVECLYASTANHGPSTHQYWFAITCVDDPLVVGTPQANTQRLSLVCPIADESFAQDFEVQQEPGKRCYIELTTSPVEAVADAREETS